MHSSGVCAHPRGSGCASASYLGSQETPCQSRDSPFLWERFGLAGRKPAVRPRAERQQHCLQQCRTDRRPDRQTAPDLGHLLGHRACRGEHGQGRGSCGRVQGHSEHGAGSQCCITAQQHPWHACGGKEGPCPMDAPGGDVPSHPAALPEVPPRPLCLPSLLCPHTHSCRYMCQLSQKPRPPPGKAAASPRQWPCRW